MSRQTGFDYELLVSRLHGGLCAFQSLRAHRRQRAQATATAPDREEPQPPRATRVADEPTAQRGTTSLEPHAFVSMGGRVVPIFGDLSLLGATATTASPQTPIADTQPLTPSAAPAPEETTKSVPLATPSALKLPDPTPPPRLGLVHGGHPRSATPASAQAARSDASAPTPAATTSEPHAGTSAGPTPAQEAANAATLMALLDERAQRDALRLEKIHADHHAAMAALLQAHRDELRARSEADAARDSQRDEEQRARSEADATRVAQLLREVLGEHRAELARAAQAHAEQLTRIASQHPSAAGHEATAMAELRGALVAHASLQREAHATVAENIDALTSIVADLGQTVSLLAVAATQADQQDGFPTRATFTAPPRVEPELAPPASPAATHVQPRIETAATSPPRVEAKPPAGAEAPVPAVSHAQPHVESAGQRRPTRLSLAEEAAARARISRALDEDRDDADLEAGDDEETPRHQPLGPITALEFPASRDRDDG